MADPEFTDNLTPREAIIDAILRWAIAVDSGDRGLLESAMASEVTINWEGYRAVGFEMPDSTVDRAVLLDGILQAMANIDTMHLMSNFRVAILGPSEARVICNTQATHYRGGQGCNPLAQDTFIMAHEYHAQVVKEGNDSLWKISDLRMIPRYTHGDPAIIGVNFRQPS
jgi:hypothetical protein